MWQEVVWIGLQTKVGVSGIAMDTRISSFRTLALVNGVTMRTASLCQAKIAPQSPLSPQETDLGARFHRANTSFQGDITVAGKAELSSCILAMYRTALFQLRALVMVWEEV